jgi:hypothetical protein
MKPTCDSLEHTKRAQPRTNRLRWTALLLALSGGSLFATAALAAPKCLENGNQCQPDKLCTFKEQLAQKVFIYQTYLRNSQVTKRMPKQRREGIQYDGALYDASVMEAQHDYPNDSAAEQMVKAGQIFQAKIKEFIQQKYQEPACSNGGMVDSKLLPKAGYTGMATDGNCRISVKYLGGDYDPVGFGSGDATSCQEFYDRDMAHEVIHQRSCEAAKKREKNLDSIADSIEDEIAAYRHSVHLTQAYVRLLSIQCSSKPNPADQKARAKRVQDLLGPYLKKATP